MEQDNRLEKLRQYARTTVLEKTEVQTEQAVNDLSSLTKQMSRIQPTATPVQKEVVSEKPQEKVDVKTKTLAEVIMEQQLQNIKEEANEEPVNQTEVLPENKQEEQVDSLYLDGLSVESNNENQSDKNTSSQKYKFRFRLLTGVFCVVLAILGGWIAGEAINITKTGTEIITETEKGAEYNVNLTKLISNISKIDQEGEPNTPGEGSLFPIEELIPITPQAVSDTTGYEEESNWFDKICNWIINIFGG